MVTDNTELAIVTQDDISPEQFKESIHWAREKARELQNIVEEKQLYSVIGGNKHLRVEAWQTIGAGYGLSAGAPDAEEVEIFGVKGAKAHAIVRDSGGNIRGEAVAYCMQDEPNWKSKPFFQLASMAQTRACSKAFRMAISWVVVLAGYDPTPSEEMDRDAARKPTRTSVKPKASTGDSPYYTNDEQCDLHGIPWREFTKDGSTWQSHKREDGGWCARRDMERMLRSQAEPAPVEGEVISMATGEGDDEYTVIG